MPLVSIGVPVYNGEKYLRLALDSLVGQDYAHLEIIISDNASEDGTEAICREFEARDGRVRYYRSDENRGAIWNFRRAFELSRGKYFMWAAFDDLRAPSYVSKCVEVLEARPNVVQCSSRIRFINEAGQETSLPPHAREEAATSASRRRRVRALARSSVWYHFYGLARADVLRQTRGPQPTWGFDVVLMLELYLRGPLAVVPEPLFSYRFFEHKTMDEAAETLGQAVRSDYSEMALNMVRAIWSTPMPHREKALLSLQFLTEFCIRNQFTRINVHHDLPASVANARAHRDYARLAALSLLAPWTLFQHGKKLAHDVRGRVALGTRLRTLAARLARREHGGEEP